MFVCFIECDHAITLHNRDAPLHICFVKNPLIRQCACLSFCTFWTNGKKLVEFGVTFVFGICLRWFFYNWVVWKTISHRASKRFVKISFYWFISCNTSYGKVKNHVDITLFFFISWPSYGSFIRIFKLSPFLSK
jgi:hypothetical protein